jgi:hypothetical protein
MAINLAIVGIFFHFLFYFKDNLMENQDQPKSKRISNESQTNRDSFEQTNRFVLGNLPIFSTRPLSTWPHQQTFETFHFFCFNSQNR